MFTHNHIVPQWTKLPDIRFAMDLDPVQSIVERVDDDLSLVEMRINGVDDVLPPAVRPDDVDLIISNMFLLLCLLWITVIRRHLCSHMKRHFMCCRAIIFGISSSGRRVHCSIE